MSDQPAHDPAGEAGKLRGGLPGVSVKADPDVSGTAVIADLPGPDVTAQPDYPLEWIRTVRIGLQEGALQQDIVSSDFGRFDWFAEPENFGRRPAAGTGRGGGRSLGESGGWQASERWHSPGGWRRGRCRQEHDLGRPAEGYPDDGGNRLRGWRLFGAVSCVALVCTAVGGVVGGFVAVSGVDSQADPSYNVSLGPPAPADRPASSVAGIAARDMPGVVMIKVNGSQGTGSGFVIRGGYIVTDNHVVTMDGLVANASIRVYFSDGKSAPARVVGRDPYSDIAVIKAIGVTGLPALTLGNSGSVAVGDPVIAIGSPLGLVDTVTSGIVSAVNRPVQPGSAGGIVPQAFFDAIQTDAPINPGNSGGPLVNARGQVIGVDAAIETLGNDPITGTQGGSIGLGFAIPVNQARRIIVQLIRTGHATHSVLGATLNENYTGAGAQIATSGLAVVPGGPAAMAGLRPGDVITKLGSQPITSAYSLLDAIRSLPPGSTVGITFIRYGQPMVAQMTLGSAGS
jgi:S1-C subfamily serine protease